jgi:Tfp pilus assembly protein PilV
MALSAQRLKAGNRLCSSAGRHGSIRTVIKPHPSIKRPFHAGRGLTLVEVMLAMLVVGFAGMGLAHLTYQMRVTAEDNIHQSTAYVMAQGYLEQICRLQYTTTPPVPPAVYSITSPAGLTDVADNGIAMFLTNSAGQQITNGILNGATYTETVYLDKDGAGNETYPMTFSVTPTLTDINPAGTNEQGIEIVVAFTESYNLGGVPRTFSSSLRTVYGNVNTM